MKTYRLFLTLLALILAKDLSAQTSLNGTWKGKSICQDKASACKDEQVVYRLHAEANSDKVTVDADRIVDGQVINMGALIFTYDKGKSTLTSTNGYTVWHFVVNENRMEGQLTRDGKIFRKVELVRDLH